MDQDGHGQHGHDRILINDAAKQQNPASYRGYLFLKVAIDRAPGPLSIAGLKKKKNHTQERSDFSIRGAVD